MAGKKHKLLIGNLKLGQAPSYWGKLYSQSLEKLENAFSFVCDGKL